MAAKGRRLFYNATNMTMSRGLACAGCHPEGRDDGHVWHEAKINAFYDADRDTVNLMGSAENVPREESKGVPRRTPMLAGMVFAPGPYGWRGESPNLRERIKAGFRLHQWKEAAEHQSVLALVESLAQFLPLGLVRPPLEERELTTQEKRGKEIFTSEAAGCAKCHVPDTAYTDRSVVPLAKLPQVSGFDDEEGAAFKTPSLRHVGGRAPYYHDGRAPTLEALIDSNADRMGKTSQLSTEERAALVAFLRSL
jgi:cytochrome c peroxidase